MIERQWLVMSGVNQIAYLEIVHPIFAHALHKTHQMQPNIISEPSGEHNAHAMKFLGKQAILLKQTAIKSYAVKIKPSNIPSNMIWTFNFHCGSFLL